MKQPTPRHYWLIVAIDGFPIDSYEECARPIAERHIAEKWPNARYRIIEVQEVPNE